jgi:hypothetical protein
MDNLDDEVPKKTSKATIIRRILVFGLAFACAGGWIYTRYIVEKHGLAGPCDYDIHCLPEAPRCLKQTVDAEGVCSRACELDGGDCAADIRCVKVELEERDERGRPLQGGYCFPQSMIDARKKRRNADGGAPPSRK